MPTLFVVPSKLLSTFGNGFHCFYSSGGFYGAGLLAQFPALPLFYPVFPNGSGRMIFMDIGLGGLPKGPTVAIRWW